MTQWAQKHKWRHKTFSCKEKANCLRCQCIEYCNCTRMCWDICLFNLLSLLLLYIVVCDIRFQYPKIMLFSPKGFHYIYLNLLTLAPLGPFHHLLPQRGRNPPFSSFYTSSSKSIALKFHTHYFNQWVVLQISHIFFRPIRVVLQTFGKCGFFYGHLWGSNLLEFSSFARKYL